MERKKWGKATMGIKRSGTLSRIYERMNLWNQEAELVPHKQTKYHGETAEVKHKESIF